MAESPALHVRRVTCCGCTQQCGLEVEVEAGRVHAVRGAAEHPFSQGYVCPKATDAPEILYHPRRVTTPMKRVGPRGSAQWQAIDWDTALDEIAARIADTTARHGAESLAYAYGTFRGGDWGIGERFLNRHGSPNACGQDKVCYASLTLGETLTYGHGPTVFTWPTPGVTRTIVVWGMRPIASAPLLWRAISRAHRAGARLVVIDPLRTQEARRADQWLAPRPGSDASLAIALLKSLIEQDLHDAAFVARECVGFEDLRAHLAGFDLRSLAADCGIALEDIAALARDIAVGPTVLNAGNGLCQSGRPVLDTARAIANLIAVSGNLGRAGAHQLAGPPRDLRANGQLLDADHLAPAQRAKRLGAERFPFIGAGYQDVDDAVAAAWHGHRHSQAWIATGHTPSLWRAIERGEPYPVKALVVQHHNPLGANPEAATAARALANPALELLVVQDLFMTPTAALADYLLPASHWLEKPYFSLGIAFVAPVGDFVAANPAAVAPVGEARSDFALWRDLGRRLGQAEAWPEREEDFYSQCLAPAGLDFATVAAAGMLAGAAARHPDHAADRAPQGYGTPSGRVELASSLLAAWGRSALPEPLAPCGAEDDRDYPLVLTTGGRALEGFHESAQISARFRRRRPHPIARLHPTAAARAGVRDGEWMNLHTPHGTVRQVAELSSDLREDTVIADRWWYPEGEGAAPDPFGVLSTNINVCTPGDDLHSDAVLGAWLLRGLPCRVTPAVAP